MERWSPLDDHLFTKDMEPKYGSVFTT